MNFQVRWALILMLSTTTTACSSWFGWLWGDNGMFRDRANDYQESRQLPMMKVPAGMDTRPIDPMLVIPKNVADSRFVGGYDVPMPQKLQVVAEGTKDFSLQVTPDQRWLIALRPPPNLWTPIRNFLSENGIHIAEEKPSMGEMVTAWQKSSDYSSVLRQAAPSTGELRLRIRIEPGVRRNTSEIFVLVARRASDMPSGEGLDWPTHSDSGALETAVLDEIQTSLSRTVTGGDSVSLLAERDYDAPSRVFLIKNSAGHPVLQLDTDFDRAWSRVGSALESADIRVEDLNRTLGIYYINLAEGSSGRSSKKQGFWGALFHSEPDPEELEARAERYQLRVAKASDGIQLSLEKDLHTLAPVEVSRHVLVLLQEHLEQHPNKKKPGGGGHPSGGPGGDDAHDGHPPSR